MEYAGAKERYVCTFTCVHVYVYLYISINLCIFIVYLYVRIYISIVERNLLIFVENPSPLSPECIALCFTQYLCQLPRIWRAWRDSDSLI